MARVLGVLSAICSTGLAMALSHSPAQACAVVAGEGKYVAIKEEKALIVWDEANRTQHFIRHSEFSSTSGDLGFLVPTPTRPQLAEVDEELFEEIDGYISQNKDIPVVDAASAPAPAAAPAAPAVQVLETRQLGHYEATVLAANDAAALNAWLGRHGYPSRPALVEWLQSYVRKGWILTAFRFKAAGGGTIESQAIRMSFRTDKPFYPYREPKDSVPKVQVKTGMIPKGDETSADSAHKWAIETQQEMPERHLSVYLLAPKKMQANVGERGRWPGYLSFAQQLDDGVARDWLKTALGAAPSSSSWWLTEFNDSSWPRPGDDEVYFSPSQDANPVMAKSKSEVRGGIDWRQILTVALGFLSLVGLLAWRRKRRP